MGLKMRLRRFELCPTADVGFSVDRSTPLHRASLPGADDRDALRPPRRRVRGRAPSRPLSDRTKRNVTRVATSTWACAVAARPSLCRVRGRGHRGSSRRRQRHEPSTVELTAAVPSVPSRGASAHRAQEPDRGRPGRDLGLSERAGRASGRQGCCGHTALVLSGESKSSAESRSVLAPAGRLDRTGPSLPRCLGRRWRRRRAAVADREQQPRHQRR
jgi:hypothetical protein